MLVKYGINVSYGELSDAIRNRANTELCPMETGVWDIDEPDEALKAIIKTSNSLNNK